jgi:hypothetical protein
MKNVAFAALLLLSTCLVSFGQPASRPYDVVVYGGTPGGVAAAIQVARTGRTVALLEPTRYLGGILVNGLGGTDVDNHPHFQNSPAVGGLALDFHRRVAIAYGRAEEFETLLKTRTKNAGIWRFEPHMGQAVIDAWVREYLIDVFYESRLSEGPNAVRKRGTVIEELRLDGGRRFRGTVFIDATIEGDLLHAAGVSTVVGRESNARYGETRNGIRDVNDYRQFAVRVDPYRVPGDSTSGLIPTIQDEPVGTPGAGDNRLQAYCFRVCLTRKPTNQIPFTQPARYDRGQYEIYLRYLRAGGKLYRPSVSIPNGKTDLGAWHDLSHNLYGMNGEYPEGSYATRQRILDEHATFTKGLFHFLANDPEVGQLDPDLQKEWAVWGYAKDEFRDNGGFPRQFYVRDARRMVSEYVLTEHHTRRENPTIAEDPVAVAYWPPDVHSVRRIVRNGAAYNEGFVFGGNTWRPFGVSYRSLVPRASECTNLLTPTCPSSSHLAYGAIRIEFTFMALGQACGTAAVLALDGKTSVQRVPYTALKKRLLQDGAVLDASTGGMPD